jgi:lysophospholipase L1-like esterase
MPLINIGTPSNTPTGDTLYDAFSKINTNALQVTSDIASKVNTSDVINTLVSTETAKPLSAAQGKVLQDGKVNISDVVNTLMSTETAKPLSGLQGKILDLKKPNLVPLKNLFNKATAVIGSYISNTGFIDVSATYDYSDFIEVTAGQPYIANNEIRFSCYFDASFNVVAGGISALTYSFTPPSGAVFTKISLYHVNLNAFQLEKGTVATTYENYQLIVDIDKVKTKTSNLVYDVPLSTSIADLAVTPAKTSFATVEAVFGKNKFNKATAVIGSYLAPDGSPASNATYDYSAFIAVTAGQPYIANNEMRFSCYYDASFNVVAGGISALSYSFTPPSGAFFTKITLYHVNLDDFQLETGTVATDFEEYITPYNGIRIANLITGNENILKLFLPKEICVAVGRTIELYNNQVSWCGNINDYHFLWSGIGKSMKRKWSLTGTTIGNNTLTLKVYSKNNILVATKTTTVKVVSATISAPFTVAAIGDSLSNQKPWGAEITSLSSANISFVGTRNSGTSEGRSGADSAYYLGNNSYTFDSLGVAGTDGRTQNLNPFWSPVTSDVNYQYYKDNYSTPNPDKLIIWLGTNGITVDPVTNATNIKTFIDKIRATGGATIPIFVVHTLFRGNQDGIGKQTGVDGYVVNSSYKLNEDLKVFNLQEKMLADLKDYSNLYLVPVSTCHDSEFNFGAVSTPVNPRASQVEFLPNEATHPQEQGYLQIADIIFSSLAAHQ